MSKLQSLNKYFVKYKWYLISGLLFVSISSYIAVLSPVIVRDTINEVQTQIASIQKGEKGKPDIFNIVFYSGITLLGLALLRGVFMFLMRQTIIVMSRHIEYAQKKEIYNHYQSLHTGFFKTHFTGDLMNRIAEDVGRVRMYTGPSIMYATNVIVLTIMCMWGMLRVNPMLTLYVSIPLPLLAISIYYVNKLIYQKSSKIQAQLSTLTTTAQESYSGIRVIKSFVQEANMIKFFNRNSELYKDSAINLSLTEAIYFPAMNLFIGLSMLSTVLIGGYFAIHGKINTGNIAEFVLYITQLMFPISAIGMVASMVQRAGASQKRIDEFLDTKPDIANPVHAVTHEVKGGVVFDKVRFTYPHTGITALKDFTLDIKPGEKVTIIGRTGSGKSTLAHLLLRMYDTSEGQVLLDGVDVKRFNLQDLRRQVGYAPQEAYLFSDTIYNNIRFGKDNATDEEVRAAARLADLEKDIDGFPKGFETMIGERGVMLSGGQKQRMVLARAILKNANLLILDDCLSAVDTQTEKNILGNLQPQLKDKTVIVITHRIFTSWTFDKIIVLDNGSIAEFGDHDSLMELNGRYAKLYRHQTLDNSVESR